MAELERDIRERLLSQAEQVRDILLASREGKEKKAILRNSSLVLFDLVNRRDLAHMTQLLEANHASGMGAEIWEAFRDQIKKKIPRFERDFPDEQQRVAAWLYFLGWLHRLGKTV